MAGLEELAGRLQACGVRPSAQRLAIASYVLQTHGHPNAEQVWAEVRQRLPVLSRATVYNTLGLFVRRGLLRELQLQPGPVVYDANLAWHHHFVDEATGEIRDVPWQSLAVDGIDGLGEFEVREHSVVLRGRLRG